MATNRSKGILRCNFLASAAMFFGAIFTILLTPAYGQQEVDPTWYDPAPTTAVVQPAQPAAAIHSSQPSVTIHRQQGTVQSASPAPKAGKISATDKQLDQSRHHAARKSVGTPTVRNEQPATVGHATLQARDPEEGSSIGPITR